MSRIRESYVYAVHSADKGLVKIGHSGEPEIRINVLRRTWGEPLALTILGVVQIECANLAERALHWRFKDQRERGEWFRIHPVDIMGLLKKDRLLELIDDYLDEFPERRVKELICQCYATPRAKRTELGHRIYFLRCRLRMTQKQLGTSVGMPAWKISQLETGRMRELCDADLSNFANMLDVSSDFLSGRVGTIDDIWRMPHPITCPK